jgi:hypothetical protein
METTTLISEREKTHGNYYNNALVTQRLKMVLDQEIHCRTSVRGLPILSVTQQDALDMICVKIGRIIAGDPSFQDHWDDIAGYAQIANKAP